MSSTTAEAYGPGANDELLAKPCCGCATNVVIATKFGFKAQVWMPASTAARKASAVADASLKRLRTDRIDLFTSTAWIRTCRSKKSRAGEGVDRAGQGEAFGMSEAGVQSIRRLTRCSRWRPSERVFALLGEPEKEVLPTLKNSVSGSSRSAPSARDS